MEKNNQKIRFPAFMERFNELKGDMTQEEFAKKLGMSRPTVAFYCAGDRIPDALGVAKIAKICGVTSDWLLGLADVQSQDLTIREIHRSTGLSEWAINKLYQTQKEGLDRDKLYVINFIIENMYGNKFLEYLFNYLFLDLYMLDQERLRQDNANKEGDLYLSFMVMGIKELGGDGIKRFKKMYGKDLNEIYFVKLQHELQKIRDKILSQQEGENDGQHHEKDD